METIKIKLFGLKKKYHFLPLGEKVIPGDIWIRCSDLIDEKLVTKDYDSLTVLEKNAVDHIRNLAMEQIKAKPTGMRFFREELPDHTSRMYYRIYLRVAN